MSLKLRSCARRISCICLVAASFAACARAEEVLPVLRINGLALEVARLVGTDGASRVAALESQWRAPGEAVLPWQRQGDWRVLAHRSGRWSEVLQVRGRGTATEAFLSRLDVERAPSPVPVLPLPPGCSARSTVESGTSGDSAIQVTGPCIGSATDSQRAWAAGLVAGGWRGGVQADGSTYRFRRGRTELVVVFIGAAGLHGADARAFTALQRQIPKEGEP